MPYAILSGALPAARMGVYMGVFNFFIVIPEITQALTFGPLIRGIFGEDNPRSPLYIVLVGGCFMLLAALLVTRVEDVGEASGDEGIKADREERLTVPESVQAVPGSGLVDKK